MHGFERNYFIQFVNINENGEHILDNNIETYRYHFKTMFPVNNFDDIFQ